MELCWKTQRELNEKKWWSKLLLSVNNFALFWSRVGFPHHAMTTLWYIKPMKLQKYRPPNECDKQNSFIALQCKFLVWRIIRSKKKYFIQTRCHCDVWHVCIYTNTYWAVCCVTFSVTILWTLCVFTMTSNRME